ncbi:hypothetical protein HYT53_00800 [Candidatus Woesearchaeota archaeon]|nr:hypothetical protein [Candidatus Woesearchaeota archaeon]
MEEAATKLEIPSNESWLQQNLYQYFELIVEGSRAKKYILKPNNGLGVISVIQTPNTIEIIDKAWVLEGIPVPERAKELIYEPVFRYDRGIAIDDMRYLGSMAALIGNFVFVRLDDYIRNAMKGIVRETSIEDNLNRGRLELIVFESGAAKFVREKVPVKELLSESVFIGPTNKYAPSQKIREKYKKPAIPTPAQLAA